MPGNHNKKDKLKKRIASIDGDITSNHKKKSKDKNKLIHDAKGVATNYNNPTKVKKRKLKGKVSKLKTRLAGLAYSDKKKNRFPVPKDKAGKPLWNEDDDGNPITKEDRMKRHKHVGTVHYDAAGERVTKKEYESGAPRITDKDVATQLKRTAQEHEHSIHFKGYKGEYYKRASLVSAEGRYAKYWLLNAKQTNGNGWGVSQQSIAKNIHKFVGKPLVVTAKSWVPDSVYGDAYEHPYLPTNDINKVLDHQEKYRVGSIVDIIEKDGDYFANIEINQKFAHMILPPFCSPAIFQNNPTEPEGQISDWEALHLAALHEDPAYGSRIALLRGTCVGTQDQCTVQFKSAKQEAKIICTKDLKGRLATLKKNDNLKQRITGIQQTAFAGPPKDVIAAFREKKPLKFREKIKGRNKEYAFQTDGKTLYQSGFPIAQHTKKGIKFSYQSHPSATTAQAGRMLGINTFTKKGKTYVNGKEIDPNTDDYIEVPTKDIQEGTFKVKPNSTPVITKDKVKRNRDQEYFRNKAEKEALAGNQDLVVQTHKKKEVLDHGSITPEEQTRINKITGLRSRAKRVFATDYHHSLPAEKGGGIGGGIFNRRITSGAVPLSKKTHMETHFPEKTIPKSFYSKLKQRIAAEGFDLEPRIVSSVEMNQKDGETIANAYDKMLHDPNNPGVKESYSAFIKETEDQFNELKKNGLRIDPIKPGTNPYQTADDLHNDLKKNNHLYYYPSEEGFGSTDNKFGDHPLLKESGVTYKGKKLLNNDVFRIVHDINGHNLANSDFSPEGEHNAFLSHRKMYSPLAGKALFTETAAQANWGSYNKKSGASNRKLMEQGRVNELVFADQKAGLLPDDIINTEWHTGTSRTGKLKQRLGVIGMPEPFEDRYETVKNTKSNLSSFKIEDPEMDYILGKTDKIRPKKQGLDRLVKNRWAKQRLIKGKQRKAGMSKTVAQIVNSFKQSGFDPTGTSGIWDAQNSKNLNAYEKPDLERIWELYGRRGMGFNSITNTIEGPNNDIGLIAKQLTEIEEEGGIPALGFDNGSLEAVNVTYGTKDEVLDKLLPHQNSTGYIDEDGKLDIPDNPRYEDYLKEIEKK